MSNAELISKEEHEALVAAAVAENVADRDDRILYLEAQIDKLKHMIFGRRSEKQVLPPGAPFQSELFTEAEFEVAEPDEEPAARRKKKRGPSKPRFADDVEREIEDLKLDESERDCEKCGGRLKDIGFESSERAHVIPARVLIRETRRHKYACSCKEAGGRIAPITPTAFPKSRVTDETRAHIVVQKFVDHCPYYRQSSILSRSGIEISDRTLCHYGIEAADRLAPIIVAMREELLASGYLQADETTIPVLKTEKQKPGAHTGFLWAYAQARGSIVFDYCRSRGSDHPKGFLEGFEGLLQVDRYQGYTSICDEDEVIDFGCWAHARRKFVEALKTARRRTEPVLELIQKLYAVEKRAREEQLAAIDRARLRQEVSGPILKLIRAQLDELVITVRPSTPLGEAIAYALNHWPSFARYIDYGEVEIDNNLIENSIRPIALGRKNYLFAGSEIGAEAAAILYSTTESCRRLGINPSAYLVDIFGRLATVDPGDPDAIRALTPSRWKAELESTLG